MKKRILIKTLVTIVPVLLVVFYLVILKFQLILNEGSEIADEHCLVVNPAVIERKQKFVEFMDEIVNQGEEDEFIAKLEAYNQANEKYIALEEHWLNKMAEFGERDDVRWITPGVLQESLWLHYKIYEAELNNSKAVQKSFFSDNEASGATALDEIAKYAKEEEEYQKQLEIIDQEIANTFDLRMKLTNPPKSKCPKESFDFPDYFEPETPVESDIS